MAFAGRLSGNASASALRGLLTRCPELLTELRVRDLAVIADVTIPLKPGLNVLTGETGAGKSMLVDALALLLGERASGDLVRPGADRAVVEAVFEAAGDGDLAKVADELGIDLGDEGLVV